MHFIGLKVMDETASEDSRKHMGVSLVVIQNFCVFYLGL